MSEIKFVELSCIRCGGQLKTVNDNTYQCISCGKMFEKQVVTDVADQLRAVLNEQKQEAVANLRRQLWAEMHEQYINSEKITDLARDIKKYLPEDYFANFCEIANSGNDRQISQFLNNTPQSAMADYADIVLDFMLKSVTASNLNSISLFIERAFKGDTQNYDKYITRYEEEAQKVNSGIYELIITRDVFLAYSSKDMNKVLELCDYLERNKISCFLALRNLRHGRGAVDNYDEALKTAIDNCKTVVFVSSTNSRDMTCDALIKELPYIKKKDFENAPAECKRNYYKIPSEYLMPRVQYLIEDYLNDGNVAEGIVDEFFHDLEWCRSKEEVARRVSAYLTETHETAAQRAERESREFQQRLEEERRKARELELRIAEAEAARVEAERRRQEEQEARQLEQQSRIEEERRKAKELELKIAEAEAARIEAERRAAEQRQNTSTDNTAAEDPNAKYCKKCRTANRKNAKFCSSCGSGEFFASFDEYLASKIKFCASCGAQNNAEDKFCAECGSRQFVPTKREYEALKSNTEEAIKGGEFKNIGDGYVTFGMYPQTKKVGNVKISAIVDKERCWYIGSDNCLYTKCEGQYYKIEPIKWKVKSKGDDWFIVFDQIIDQHCFDENSNNYANSEIRSWLNGEFYKKVFTEVQRNLILTTNVDNSVSSTGYSTNQYICDDTNDKIFLLSRKEAEQYFNSSSARQKTGTDYAKARGIHVSSNGNSYWWLRSRYDSNSNSVQYVGVGGTFYWSSVRRFGYGIVPALKIKV